MAAKGVIGKQGFQPEQLIRGRLLPPDLDLALEILNLGIEGAMSEVV